MRPVYGCARVGYASLTAAGRRILEESRDTAEMIGREIVPEDGDTIEESIRMLDRIAGKEPERPAEKRAGRA